MTAQQFVIEHLRGTAEGKGLPRLSVDETVKEDLFTTAFNWLTEGVSPEILEIAHLLHDLDKKGVKIPDINYGQPLGTLA